MFNNYNEFIEIVSGLLELSSPQMDRQADVVVGAVLGLLGVKIQKVTNVGWYLWDWTSYGSKYCEKGIKLLITDFLEMV